MWDVREVDFTCSRCGASYRLIKNSLHVFENKMLQNGIFHFVFTDRQKFRCKGRIYADEKLAFLKRAWHLKG